MREIEEFGRCIGRQFRPRQVVLFGSYARGTATADSDVDVLVVMPLNGRPVEKSVEIRLKTNPLFPLDLLVRTPEAVRADRDGRPLSPRHPPGRQGAL